MDLSFVRILFPLRFGVCFDSRLLIPGEDTYHSRDQSKIAVPLIKDLLANVSGKDAEGKPLLTPKDLSAALSRRYADAKATNPEFTTSFNHRMFGASKYVFPITVALSL